MNDWRRALVRTGAGAWIEEVFHPQVVGLALGMSARELAIDRHMVLVHLPLD